MDETSRGEPAEVRAPPVTGVVLAGGLGRRMGGVDKGLQLLDGKPMALWAIERLRPQVDEVLINANQNAAQYAAFGHPVHPDVIEGFAGPLAGLHVALSCAAHPWVATVPCDSPFLPADLIARLRRGVVAGAADLAVAQTFDQPHPVFCLCRRSLRDHLATFLAEGGRKVDHWYASLRVAVVAFDDVADAFRNINTRDELAAFSRLRGD